MPGKFTLPNYTLYVDANIAYSRKPIGPLPSKFVAALEKARKLTTVNVRLPSVVVEELIYQQFQTASAAASNLGKNLKTLTDLCGECAHEVPNSEKIEKALREKFSLKFKEIGVAVIPTPIKSIDWESVVQDSCWRRQPFEKPKSEDDLAEKGFRDKIILETIIHDIASLKSGVGALISADNLLSSTFRQRAKSLCAIESHAGFEDFLGHLQLLDKTKSEEFTQEVFSKVESVFYNRSDGTGLAASHGVLERLTNEYGDEMSRPSFLNLGSSEYAQLYGQRSTLMPSVAGTQLKPLAWSDEMDRWAPVTELKILASPPVYQSGYNDGRYHWKTTVTLARLLRRKTPRPGQQYGVPEERIKLKNVDVMWSCNIDLHTAQFSNLSVDGYEPSIFDSFVDADWNNRTLYGFPLFPGMEETIS